MSLVDNVEHQLHLSETRVRGLERRVQSLEANAGIVKDASASVENTALAY